MSKVPDLLAIEHRAQRLLEMLKQARVTSLDFDNREHLHVIGMCLDLAISHVEMIK